jgi:hypothetical protein
MMSGATRTPENISTVVIQFATAVESNSADRSAIWYVPAKRKRKAANFARVYERAADLSEMHQFFQVQDHDQVPHTRN